MDISGLGAWTPLLQDELQKPYFEALCHRVDEACAKGAVYPPAKDRFAAFALTPPQSVRVVILGQDPYHEEGQAQGLAFYVPPEVTPPPSLRNIAKELGHMPDLMSWARQGVLLLNATLTVAAHQAGSHQGRGWERFTDAVVRALAERREYLVFILWGSYAQRKGAIVDRSRHCVIASAHPSPLSASRGFFGSRPFARANEYLAAHSIAPVEW